MRWQFVPREAGAAFDLRMDFDGYTGDSDDRHALKQHATYRIVGDSFELVEGSNPVPSI